MPGDTAWNQPGREPGDSFHDLGFLERVTLSSTPPDACGPKHGSIAGMITASFHISHTSCKADASPTPERSPAQPCSLCPPRVSGDPCAPWVRRGTSSPLGQSSKQTGGGAQNICVSKLRSGPYIFLSFVLL